MTPHDKIKAALQTIVDTTDFIHPEHENQVVDALELLETHKLVPKDAGEMVDLDALKREMHERYLAYSCGNADQCCFESVSWVIDHLAPMLRPVEPIEGLED